MIEFIRDNIGTIICGAVVLLILVLVIRSLIKDKKKGRSSCGCSCAHCAMAGRCHEISKKR